MKIGNKVWSKAASVALAATLGAFMCAPAVGGLVAAPGDAGGVQQAWAAGTGNITIKNVDNNNTQFTGYQIFKADVDSSKNVSNIEWATEGMATAFTNAVNATSGLSYTGTTAQEAADFIQLHITSNEVAASGSFANNLAKQVKDVTGAKTVTTTGTSTDKTATGLAEGYWLFMTSSGTGETDDNVATAPLFYTVIASGTNEVTEKTKVPTVDKQVKKGDETYADATDAQVGDTLTFQLTGTLPSNYATYDTYKYSFEDTPTGMDIDKDSVKVYLNTVSNDNDITSLATTTNTTNKKLEVSFNDLKTSVTSASADSKIIVVYKAKLNDSAKTGTGGNENSATVKYSNDPYTDGTGTSEPDTNKVFTYSLNLNKVDLGTEQALSGATFTIQNATSKQYVKTDGTYTTDESEAHLTVSESGVLSIKSIDVGTYTVHEVSAPTGYNTVTDFNIMISASVDSTNKTVSNLTVTIGDSTRNDVIAGTVGSSSTAGDNKLTAAEGTSSTLTSDAGTVTVTVGDAKNVGLPITGMSGVTWTLVAGGAVLFLTIGYGVHASRKRRQEERE